VSTKCRRVRHWAAFDPNDLDARRRRTIQEHIESCSECMDFIEESQRIDEKLLGAQHVEVPGPVLTGFWEGVYHKISVRHEAVYRSQKRSVYPIRSLLVWGIPSMVVCTLLFLLILSGKQPSFDPLEGFADQVSVQSATIEGKDARISIFRTEEPEMTFLWFETDETINGG